MKTRLPINFHIINSIHNYYEMSLNIVFLYDIDLVVRHFNLNIFYVETHKYVMDQLFLYETYDLLNVKRLVTF